MNRMQGSPDETTRSRTRARSFSHGIREAGKRDLPRRALLLLLIAAVEGLRVGEDADVAVADVLPPVPLRRFEEAAEDV